jgi:hypothetical protein
MSNHFDGHPRLTAAKKCHEAERRSRVFRLHVPLIAAVVAASLSLGLSPSAFADDTDTQFIGDVSFYLQGTYLNSATINALIADANKVCAMSNAGFSEEAREFIVSKWHPSDSFGFMMAATKA